MQHPPEGSNPAFPSNPKAEGSFLTKISTRLRGGVRKLLEPISGKHERDKLVPDPVTPPTRGEATTRVGSGRLEEQDNSVVTQHIPTQFDGIQSASRATESDQKKGRIKPLATAICTMGSIEKMYCLHSSYQLLPIQENAAQYLEPFRRHNEVLRFVIDLIISFKELNVPLAISQNNLEGFLKHVGMELNSPRSKVVGDIVDHLARYRQFGSEDHAYHTVFNDFWNKLEKLEKTILTVRSADQARGALYSPRIRRYIQAWIQQMLCFAFLANAMIEPQVKKSFQLSVTAPTSNLRDRSILFMTSSGSIGVINLAEESSQFTYCSLSLDEIPRSTGGQKTPWEQCFQVSRTKIHQGVDISLFPGGGLVRSHLEEEQRTSRVRAILFSDQEKKSRQGELDENADWLSKTYREVPRE